MGLPLNQVVLGNCIEVMAEWPENSVDCVVTDPPYGIQFMGLDFDKALPPRAAFEQMIRVLKPGALAFVMSSPRQDVLWRMLSMLEGVGFNLRTSLIVWVYRTGFPKSFDVSKGIDRKLGLEREVVDIIIRGDVEEAKKKGVTFTKAKANRNNKAIFGYGIEKITRPASELAKKWEGWKSQTGLKPAAEVVLMVNKPRSEKTIVDNVLKWGTGAINVDNCRIPFQSEEDKSQIMKMQDAQGIDITSGSYGKPNRPIIQGSFRGDYSKGRFPANLLIQNGALDTGETTKSGLLEPHHHISEERAVYGEYVGRESISSYGDEDSPFRFFDLDAWAEHHGFLDVAKPSKAERDMGLWTQPLQIPKSKFNLNDGSKDMRFDGVIPTPRRNIHPTTKPIRLMAYLITLGCPKDGVVVDPFLGSGTTCIAAKKLRRKWIGIEINPEYAELAEARINVKGPLDQYLEAEK